MVGEVPELKAVSHIQVSVVDREAKEAEKRIRFLGTDAVRTARTFNRGSGTEGVLGVGDGILAEVNTWNGDGNIDRKSAPDDPVSPRAWRCRGAITVCVQCCRYTLRRVRFTESSSGRPARLVDQTERWNVPNPDRLDHERRR